MPVDILTLGAHMGDEVAWGMALAAHRRQGLTVGMLHLTPGEKGHKTMSPAEYAAQKQEEARSCAEVLGAQMWTLPYGDGELPVSEEVKWRVADIIREAKPRMIITHWRGSMHKDHTAAADNLPDALFYAALPAFKRELPHHSGVRTLFGENWEDLRGYEPEVYLEALREDLETWERAMRCYALFRGEVSTFPYLDYYRALARTRGCEVGYELAVTFAVPPEARRRRLQSLL
ncbi:MAG TPA: PIG-L family deacetylase [Fimbriimonadaceae bacterium]|nr:PIG-L family deacetylase [Fimbriimonadaceae bacterium]